MKKRIVAALLTGALLSLTLCACTSKNAESNGSDAGSPGSTGTGTTVTTSEPSLRSIDNKEKGSLALDMARADVEALLPLVNGSETEAMGTTYAYFGSETENEVYVGFVGGVVTALSVGGSFQSQEPVTNTNWTLKGITLGDSRADVEKILGKASMESPVTTTSAEGEATVAENQVTLQYYYDADDNLVSDSTQNAKIVVGILLDGDTVRSFGTFTLVQAGNAVGDAPADGAAE